MDINLLVNITSRAWALPILAHLHDGVPGRQAPLLSATRASRTAFAQSLAHLIEIGLLERNPGHGHPLRPEFRLTPKGQVAAQLAHRVHAVPGEHKALLRRSWTLPILTTLKRPSRFTTVKQQLGSITDRALSQSLQTLEDHDWISRTVDGASRPPHPVYRAINTGQVISEMTRPVVTLR
ncbi:HxlR-like helix-turn-helix [Falsiruegeria litorea R37]|uniref:HxlR-like helix-turn-helix n=1 Tax=Falsiruegeria litorea R37 TaxID=1200284 RepID=A0A1Y5T6T3_9RHOB|nr:winged helix-turn-helix transcriptional regulator [Falsiruegeria litorea]SLN57166.1 HxlR-like helix-turn-helix [Falsiruegeria litorea R37]